MSSYVQGCLCACMAVCPRCTCIRPCLGIMSVWPCRRVRAWRWWWLAPTCPGVGGVAALSTALHRAATPRACVHQGRCVSGGYKRGHKGAEELPGGSPPNSPCRSHMGVESLGKWIPPPLGWSRTLLGGSHRCAGWIPAAGGGLWIKSPPGLHPWQGDSSVDPWAEWILPVDPLFRPAWTRSPQP